MCLLLIHTLTCWKHLWRLKIYKMSGKIRLIQKLLKISGLLQGVAKFYIFLKRVALQKGWWFGGSVGCVLASEPGDAGSSPDPTISEFFGCAKIPWVTALSEGSLNIVVPCKIPSCTYKNPWGWLGVLVGCVLASEPGNAGSSPDPTISEFFGCAKIRPLYRRGA